MMPNKLTGKLGIYKAKLVTIPKTAADAPNKIEYSNVPGKMAERINRMMPPIKPLIT